MQQLQLQTVSREAHLKAWVSQDTGEKKANKLNQMLIPQKYVLKETVMKTVCVN